MVPEAGKQHKMRQAEPARIPGRLATPEMPYCEAVPFAAAACFAGGVADEIALIWFR